MRDRDDLYKEYLKCYESGRPLSRLKSKDETFQVLSLKQGLPVKYIHIQNVLDLPMDIQCIGKDGFYMTQKGFYIIPNDYKGKIISFVLRGLKKQYLDVPCMSRLRPLFGWSTFENFKQNEPIIVTEGTKDCIILQQYYPFVLALLTAGITMTNLHILRALTNKVILAYDRDSSGLDSTKRDIKLLQDKGFQVQMLRPHKKDFGEDYNDSEYLQKEIQHKLHNFSALGAIL